MLFVDTAPQPNGGFATGLLGPRVGTRVWPCEDTVRFQQVAELVALVKGIKLSTARGWVVLHTILQALGPKASIGLIEQYRILRDLVLCLEKDRHRGVFVLRV